ncbi:MAG TPA: hypothetical protein VEG39_09625 [Clostridia bacterium]|nr:hypothetical protein [Clostridia bacterium]
MKKIIIAVIALLLAVSLAGCIPDSLGEYKKAVEKTEQIKKGRTTGEYAVVMDFNTEGMTEEQIRELNYFRNVEGSFDAVSDDEAGKGILRNYLSLGGLGFDFDLFINGDEVFMKLPVIGKYLRIDELQASMKKEQDGQDMELISGESQEEIGAKWLGLLKKEDIFKGRDIVLTTPDGEVKTTEYTIKLKDEQIKSLAADVADILLKDEKLRENFEKYAKKDGVPLKDKDIEEILAGFKEDIKNYTVENFSYIAYVDIDGYIVNKMIELSLKIENVELKVSDEKRGILTGVSYKLDIKNWDINKEQKFEFPVLTEDNTLEMNQMDENMPFMIEDLMDNKD